MKKEKSWEEKLKCVVCEKICSPLDSRLFVTTSGADGERSGVVHEACYNTWIGWNR
jgi:hypothetical protein